MEIWKEVDWVDGYRGVLEVSNTGRVRRKAYEYETGGRWGTLHKTTKPDKELASCIANHGYPEIAVQVAGKRRKFRVHQLVARAFAPGFAPGLSVNHINGVKTDNRVENLEWVTLARNTELQWQTGLANARGDLHPGRKLNSGQVRIIRRLLSIGANANELSVLIGVDPKTIYGIASGKRWSSV